MRGEGRGHKQETGAKGKVGNPDRLFSPHIGFSTHAQVTLTSSRPRGCGNSPRWPAACSWCPLRAPLQKVSSCRSNCLLMPISPPACHWPGRHRTTHKRWLGPNQHHKPRRRVKRKTDRQDRRNGRPLTVKVPGVHLGMKFHAGFVVAAPSLTLLLQSHYIRVVTTAARKKPGGTRVARRCFSVLGLVNSCWGGPPIINGRISEGQR